MTNKLLYVLPLMFLLFMSCAYATELAGWTLNNALTSTTNICNLSNDEGSISYVSNQNMTFNISGTVAYVGYYDGSTTTETSCSELKGIGLGDDYTVSFWMRDYTNNSHETPVSRGTWSAGGWDFRVVGADTWIAFEKYNQAEPNKAACDSVDVVDGQWHHVLGRFRESDNLIDIWIDGVFCNSAFHSRNGESSTYPTGLGARTAFNDRNYDGYLSSVHIWDEYISNSSIVNLFNYDTTTTPAPSPFFAVTSKDFWTNGSVSSFWAYIDGSNYSSNYTGTLNTTLLQNDTSLYTIQVGGTNYYTETYTDVNISSNFEGVLHQSETSFYPVEYLTNYQLWSSWYDNMSVTVDGRSNQSVIETVTGNYSVFYLNSAEHTVQINLSDYYTVNWVVNISAGTTNRIVWTNSSGLFYNNLVTFNLKDVVTTDLVEVNTTILIEGVSDSGGTMSLQTYTSTNGTVSFPFLQGTFNITAYSDDYATLIENVTINSTVQEFNYSLYANNSLWVTAIDQVTGSALNNFAVEVFNVNDSFTAVDNLTFKATLDNITSGVYTVKVTKDDYAVAEYALTMTGGSHQNLIAYMTANGSTTIFNVVDSLSSQIIEGASASMYKTINSTWTLISSQNTDITGRVQYTYVPDVEYKFIIDAVGFELRTFFLKPLFSSYTIRLTPDLVSVPDENTGAYVYSINNSGLFYNSLNNSFEVSISSGTGTLEYYDLTVTNFNGSSSSVNCLTADGCSDSFLVEVVDSYFGDFVTVEYSIKESGRSLKYFKNVYHVQDVFISSTLEAWKDVDDDTVDSLGKAFIAMIICFVTVGFVAVSSSMVGVPPVTASGVVLAMLVGVFAYVGFIPALAGGLVILGCIMIVIFGRGEI